MSIRAISIGLGAAALLATTANASDLSRMQPTVDYGSAFNFDGFYLGATAGGLLGSTSAGSVGVVAGSNFSLTNAFIGGLEFQGDAIYNGGTTYDFLTLGRLGVVLTDNIMLYGDAGAGWVAGNGSYALGGGAEFALTNAFSVRGEILGLANWGSGLNTAKATAGILYHFQ